MTVINLFSCEVKCYPSCISDLDERRIIFNHKNPKTCKVFLLENDETEIIFCVTSESVSWAGPRRRSLALLSADTRYVTIYKNIFHFITTLACYSINCIGNNAIFSLHLPINGISCLNNFIVSFYTLRRFRITIFRTLGGTGIFYMTVKHIKQRNMRLTNPFVSPMKSGERRKYALVPVSKTDDATLIDGAKMTRHIAHTKPRHPCLIPHPISIY